ncbi:MAG: hypothetical protein H6Q70_2687 [Firmicutes bacterium]|nr:hypothetical protein [Bacillota bacterium]
MLRQFLAQYLLNKDLLSSQQVLEILEDDKFQRVAPGVVALHKGLLTAEQIEKIQRIQIAEDQLFGEVAVNEKLLTEEQVGSILAAREDSNLSVAQEIISRGFMTLEELGKALEEYRDNNQLSIDESFNKIEFNKICCEDFEEVRELYVEYTTLFLEALVNFMGIEGVIVSSTELDSNGKWLITQRMNGEINLGTGLLLSDEVVVKLAQKYSKEDITEVDQLALDSVAEFLNVVNGLFVVSLSNNNLDVDLEPQKFSKGVMPIGSKRVIINIDTKDGLIQLLIAADGIQ